MANSVWVHPQFDPVAFSLGPIAVHWYGLMYLLAFTLVIALGRYRLTTPATQGLGMTARDLDDLLVFGVLGVVLGGRLGYVIFYRADHYLANPLEVLAIWQGGMSFHGGLIGVILALYFFSARRGLRFLALGDFIAPLVPLGLAAGRLGNFINGELWGRVADPSGVPWAMVFPHAGPVARHPSQIYEMLAEGFALFVVVWWFSKRPRPAGSVCGFFLLGYGLARFGVEFFREPDTFMGLTPLGMSMGQWLSLPMIVIGAWLMKRAYRSSSL